LSGPREGVGIRESNEPQYFHRLGAFIYGLVVQAEQPVIRIEKPVARRVPSIKMLCHCERAFFASEAISLNVIVLSALGDCFVATLLAMTRILNQEHLVEACACSSPANT